MTLVLYIRQNSIETLFRRLKASAMPGTATDATVARSVCLFVTLVHSAKADGRNEMSFGRNTHVFLTN